MIGKQFDLLVFTMSVYGVTWMTSFSHTGDGSFAGDVSGDWWDERAMRWSQPSESVTLGREREGHRLTIRLQTEGFFPHLAAIQPV